MTEKALPDLKEDIQHFMEKRGALKVRVANPRRGFENAAKGCHPLDVMSNCNSVIVFALYVGLDYYRIIKIEGKTEGDNRIGHIFRDWLAHELTAFLKARGFDALMASGWFDRSRKMARLSYKLVAYEAGIGVYGRSGVIITPEYGPRVNIGVVLTNAALEPDGKLDFNPCQNCETCARACPANAIPANISPHMSYDREGCIGFIEGLREETGDKDFLCGYCYELCPIGTTRKRGYLISRKQETCRSQTHERENLVQKALHQ